MENTTSVCEALICGNWHLISVEILHGNNEILRRCPECHTGIKLMKVGRNGQRAHFEHDDRNPNCRTGSAFGWDIEYINKPVVETMHDKEKSYIHAGLLDYAQLNFSAIAENEMDVYWEGAKKYITHLSYERDAKLSNNKKISVFKEKGKLACEACAFDFQKKYGERGAGFMECHHNNPVSEMNGSITVILDDLTLLCANCHRIIHRSNPLITLDQLKEMLAKQATVV